MDVPGIDAVTLGLRPSPGARGIWHADQGKVIDDYRTRLIEAARRPGKEVSMLVGFDRTGRAVDPRRGEDHLLFSEVEILRRGIMEAATRLHAVK